MRHFLKIVTVTMRYFLKIVTVTMFNLFLIEKESKQQILQNLHARNVSCNFQLKGNGRIMIKSTTKIIFQKNP